MVNAHCADALVCISNCDKITPGMLMAAMRLNIPVVFISGGPMEAGKILASTVGKSHNTDSNDSSAIRKLDLVDAMMDAADDSISDEDVAAIEASACPTCGSCSGMFCQLDELLDRSVRLGYRVMARYSLLIHYAVSCFWKRDAIVSLAKRRYEQDDDSVLPRSIATKAL